jgi:hypothetical protein
MRFFSLALVLSMTVVNSAMAFTLKEYVEKNTIVLDRPMMTFHYRQRGPVPTTQEEIFQQVAKVTRGYNDISRVDGNVAGPGLYVSVDPTGTREFGGGFDTQLVVLNLKKGTRIFRDSISSAEISEYAKTLQCFDEKSLIKSVMGMRGSKSEACRRAAIDVLSELHVEAISFGYQATDKLENCKTSRSIALNLIAASAIDPASTAFYSDTIEVESSSETASFIKRLYNEGLKSDEIHNRVTMSHLKSLATLVKASDMQDGAYTQLKKDLIYMCGPQRTIEPELVTLDYAAYSKFLLNAIQGGNYSVSMINAFSSYGIKFTKTSFDIKQLRALLKAQYRMANGVDGTLNFQDWLRAQKKTKFLLGPNGGGIVSSQANEKLKEISTLLQEKTVEFPITSGFSILQNMKNNFLGAGKDVFLIYPGILPSAYLEQGLGPRITVLLTSENFPIPLVVGPLPSDPLKDYSAQMIENRAQVVRILNQCTAEYNDPAKTAEQIQAGDCGTVDFSKVED